MLRASTNSDDLLAGLLEGLLEQHRLGVEPDVQGVVAKFPMVGRELLELWAISRMTDNLLDLCFQSTAVPKNVGYPSLFLSESPGAWKIEGAVETLPRISGDYELLEVLGRGGMGVVFRARQRSLNRFVALKMIRWGIGAEPLELARFQAEILASASLSHPNLVPVLEAGVTEGQPFYTMPLIVGETLAARLHRGPIRQGEAARIMPQVADAIHHAHTHGLLHRDLKPSNILMDLTQKPLVTDFGLSKVLPGLRQTSSLPDGPDTGKTQLTGSGSILGTPCYVAPEQINRAFGNPSKASDVYSLGVILYEMITGRPPFRGASPIETLLLVLDQEPVRPRLLNPKVNQDMELICLTCLQKKPALRYASAGELAKDLQAWQERRPLSVRQGGFLNPGIWLSRVLRETHHATVLENWGLLWMWHGAMVLLICILTWILHHSGMDTTLGYMALWGGGLAVWGAIFWRIRTQGGPVLFVERQVAHAWAGAVVAVICIFICEILLNLKPLDLSPVLPIITGMLFIFKAGMLSGEFYLYALACFLCVAPMALFPEYNQLIFGTVIAFCFFIPGLRYHRQRLKSWANSNIDVDSFQVVKS